MVYQSALGQVGMQANRLAVATSGARERERALVGIIHNVGSRARVRTPHHQTRVCLTG